LGLFYKELSWSFEDLQNYPQTLREVPHSRTNFGGRCFVFWSAPTEEDEPVGWGSSTVPQKCEVPAGDTGLHPLFSPTIPWLPEPLHKILAKTLLH
jgi:hypothetical protein